MNRCEVIRDLILLYTADECSQASKEIVENHVKSCEACGNYLKELQGTDIVEKVVVSPEELEQKTKDFQVKKGFRKIKVREKILLLCVIALIPVLVGCGLLTQSGVIGKGSCLSNLDDAYRLKRYFKHVQERDYEKVFEDMDIQSLYQQLTDQELFYSIMGDNGQDFEKCARYYQKMGFEAYKEKQKEVFMQQMEMQEETGIKIVDIELAFRAKSISDVRDESISDSWDFYVLFVLNDAEGKQESRGYNTWRTSEDGVTALVTPMRLDQKTSVEQFEELFGLWADVDDVLGYRAESEK